MYTKSEITVFFVGFVVFELKERGREKRKKWFNKKNPGFRFFVAFRVCRLGSEEIESLSESYIHTFRRQNNVKIGRVKIEHAM